MPHRPTATTSRRCVAAARVPVLLVGVVLVVVLLAGGLTAVVLMRGDDAAPPPPRDTSDAEIAALQEQFKRYIENRLDFTNLLPEVKAYTRRYPDSVAGNVLLAQVLMKLEQYEEAYPALQTALAGSPANFELLKLTGACAAKLHRWDDAERYFVQADALKEDMTVILQLGNVYFQTGRVDEAEARYQDAMPLSGTNPPHKAFAGLAEVAAARGDYGDALNQIDFAIDFAAGDSEADISDYRLKRVRILFEAGRWEEGKRELDAIPGEFPGVIYTLPHARLRARMAEHDNDLASAVREVQMLRALSDGQNPLDLADIYAELAHWQLKQGDHVGAADSLRALRELMPTHPRLPELEQRLAG